MRRMRDDLVRRTTRNRLSSAARAASLTGFERSSPLYPQLQFTILRPWLS
jgi:hypothetical protein